MDGINKKPMQDMLAPGREPMRKSAVPPSAESFSSRADITDRIARNSFFERGPTKTALLSNGEKGSGRGRIWWVVLMIVMVAGGAFLAANYFTGATIEIVPITEQASLDHEFTAVKDAGPGSLPFQFMSLEEERGKEVPATIEKKVQYKASGTVVVYNAYSGNSQRLIKNTRLESSDHKVFRIRDSVVVPGATVVGGKVVSPGSVTAVVDADVPGKEYNIGLADFTIPGFKESNDLARYAKFTARSAADSPLSGGFSGTINVPTEEAIATAHAALKEELKDIALKKVRAEIPESVSFFPGSVILKFEEIPQELSAATVSIVRVKATVSVFFFDTELLTKKIAGTVISDYKGNALTLSNITELSFSFVDPVDTVILSDLARITFALSGKPSFVGKIDTAKIAADIAGKEKNDFAKIITLEDNIQKADAVIRPFWHTTFPALPAQIEVNIVEN